MDRVQLVAYTQNDCNGNDLPDECDVAEVDCNDNGVPDDCDPDFDLDQVPDDCDPDIDGDGVVNEDDVCGETPLGEAVSPSGGPMGDINDDCRVTLADYSFFEVCLELSGPDRNPGFPDCLAVFDFDGDDDVDLVDFAEMQEAFDGK